MINYLLEKSRVVHQAEASETTTSSTSFSLCAKLTSFKAQFDALEATEYHYMNQSGVIEIAGMSDLKEFKEMRNAMNVLSMEEDLQTTILKLVAGLLHVGNIAFEVETHATQEDGSKISAPDALALAVKLLGVDAELLTKALTSKNIGTRSVILVSYSVAQAIETRDTLTKAIYSKLFDFIIKDINARLAAQGSNTAESGSSESFICVLDIFGLRASSTIRSSSCVSITATRSCNFTLTSTSFQWSRQNTSGRVSQSNTSRMLIISQRSSCSS